MPEQKVFEADERRNTDLAEGELDTVEADLRAHEGKRETVPEKKVTEQGLRMTDLAEGELDTVEASIRIHEQRGDQQGRPPSEK